MYYYTVSQKTGHVWSITSTNIGQYQCHLIELFVQHFLIIYYKNYSHRRVPVATVTIATSATRADQRLWYYSAPAHRVRVTVEYLRHTTPDFISPDVWPNNCPNLNTVDYRMWSFGQRAINGPSMSGESGFRPVSV